MKSLEYHNASQKHKVASLILFLDRTYIEQQRKDAGSQVQPFKPKSALSLQLASASIVKPKPPPKFFADVGLTTDDDGKDALIQELQEGVAQRDEQIAEHLRMIEALRASVDQLNASLGAKQKEVEALLREKDQPKRSVVVRFFISYGVKKTVKVTITKVTTAVQGGKKR